MSGSLARPPKVWYNDNDPFCVAWLKNLIAAGYLPAGDVDDRPIQEVQASDLAGYDQCHFFAGIGGWPYAMQLAGWDGPLWTGSCPCQPFSAAGHALGADDPRHLWPAWRDLIAECRPSTVAGEQVASADGLGWLDLVYADMEAMGYAVGATALCAASQGTPHARHRLWFVATLPNTDGLRREGQWTEAAGTWSEQQFARLLQDQLESALPAGRYGALADGISGRVGRLRAYGNAIVPQVGASFLRAVQEVI